MTEPEADAVFFEELATDERYAHLWSEGAAWDEEVAADPKPWGLTGPTPLVDLMDQVQRNLTPQQVVDIERSVLAELMLRAIQDLNEEVTDEWSEDRPAGDAGVAAEPGGPALVDEHHRGDPTDPGRG